MGQQESAFPVSATMRKSLNDLQQALLTLHKVLVDAERAEYERANGTVSNNEMLQLLLSNEDFAWLRTLSKMIIVIDDMTSVRKPAPAYHVPPLMVEVRKILEPEDNGNEYETRFFACLTNNAAAVKARDEALSALKSCEHGY